MKNKLRIIMEKRQAFLFPHQKFNVYINMIPKLPYIAFRLYIGFVTYFAFIINNTILINMVSNFLMNYLVTMQLCVQARARVDINQANLN